MLHCLAFCPSDLAHSSKHFIVHKLGMDFGLGAVTWIAGSTHGVGLAVRATVDPLLVYTTTFGIYAEYNSQSRQIAKHLVGCRLSERHTHRAANALSCLTHIQTHRLLPSELSTHIRPVNFVLYCVSTCVLPPVPTMWVQARRGPASGSDWVGAGRGATCNAVGRLILLTVPREGFSCE